MLSGEETAWADVVRGLARRVLGPLAEPVRFAARESAGRGYAYEAKGGVLTVSATDGVSASVALHHYLRERCGLSVGWDTVLPLPLTSLPDAPLREGTPRVREGYYFNFCTFSYTTPYWDWTEWEREIDWMALHGITMPLAVTGHEAALHAAYSVLGLDDDQIRSFLGGPGYLPFQFMGCLDGFAGPLPTSWIEGHRRARRAHPRPRACLRHDARAAGLHRARPARWPRRPRGPPHLAGFRDLVAATRPTRLTSASAPRSPAPRSSSSAPTTSTPPTRSSR